MPPADVAEDYIQRELYLLRSEMERAVNVLTALQTLVPVAPETVNVEVSDEALARIVTSVASLKPGADATDIAEAIKTILPVPDSDTDSAILAAIEKLTKSLERQGQIIGSVARSFGSAGDGKLRVGDNIVDASHPVPVSQGRIEDPGNTATCTSANGASAFTGTKFATDGRSVVRNQVRIASNVASGLGGTFTFNYYAADQTTLLITETRTINTFATVRDFDLKNEGAYFQVVFTPSRALTGAEQIFITTYHDTQFAGPFVRLADQEIEQDNAAMPNHFAYAKAFDPFTRLSVNQRPQAVLLVPTTAGSSASTPLANGAVYLTTSNLATGFSSVRLLVATDQVSASDGVKLEWSDTSTFTVVRATDAFSYTAANVAAGFATYNAVVKGTYLRIRYTNGGVSQGAFYVTLFFNSSPFLDETTLATLNDTATGQQSVTNVAVQLPTTLSTRRAFTLKNLSSSARALFYGFSSGVTTSTGFELAPGESIDRDWPASVGVWVIQAGGGGTVTACWDEGGA